MTRELIMNIPNTLHIMELELLKEIKSGERVLEAAGSIPELELDIAVDKKNLAIIRRAFKSAEFIERWHVRMLKR